MDLVRDPGSKGLLVRHPGPVPSGGRVKVDAGSAGFLVRQGRLAVILKVGTTQIGAALLGPDAPAAPLGSPLDCELWYVSTLPTGGISVVGGCEVYENGISIPISFSGTCGMACTDPAKFVTKLLQTRLPLDQAYERVLLGQHVLDALRSTVQASLDASTMTVLYLREDEPTKLILDYALMAGRQFLGSFGVSFLGFDAGRFDVPPGTEDLLQKQPPPLAESLRITGHELTIQSVMMTSVRVQTDRHRPAAPVDPLAMTPGGGMPAAPANLAPAPAEGSPAYGPPSSSQSPSQSEPASQPVPAARNLASTPYPLSRESARKAPVMVQKGYSGTAVAVVQEGAFPAGSKVRAQASDGQWYAGIVVRCEGNKVEVAFADGGPSELLDLKRVTHG